MANEHARARNSIHRDSARAQAEPTAETAARADALRTARRTGPGYDPEDEMSGELLEPLELPKVSKLKIAWVAWRAARKWKKGKIIMDYVKPVSTPILQSKTTRDVATGAAAAGGTAYGLLAAARAILGDAAMPWDPSADAAIAVAATALLTPLLARLKALFRRGSTT